MYATGIDNVSHRMGKRRGLIDHYYEYVDGLLGELVAVAPPNATVPIVSDHGWSYARDDFGHEHAPDGVFLLSGPGVRVGDLSASPHVNEVAGTVLALLGLPVNAAAPERVVWEALPAEVRATARRREAHRYATLTRQPPRAVDASRLQEETMERLKALGYVR
jgi:hypothetical protein